MAYLYGDSTPSTLDENFIEFLRDSIDACVAALVADERARHRAERTADLRGAAEVDRERLKELGAAVAAALKGFEDEPDSPASQCAAEILRSTNALVDAANERVAQRVEQEVANLDGELGREREKCIEALEAFLLRYDLPKTTYGWQLRIKGHRYSALLRTKTSFGLRVAFEVDVPDEHLFDRHFRVDRVTERLEVHAPDSGGWLHREGRVRPQRLEKLFVTELAVEGALGTIKLRTAAESTTGIDVTLGEGDVQLVRVSEREGNSAPFQVSEEDAKTLTALHEKLSAAVRDLTGPRKKLVEAHLDDVALRDHDDPAELVVRIVAALAPTAQEIARRSPSSSELVLKRLLSDNRREEIFVTKAELRAKLEPLSPGKRALFEPLGLSESTASLPPLPPPLVRSAPPPPVRAEPSRRPPAPDSRLPPLPTPKNGGESERLV